jgi:hypothetical protein
MRVDVLTEVDRLVAEKEFPNRSRAIESLVSQKLSQNKQNRLLLECAKLEPQEERALAEEGMDSLEWPTY